MTPEIRQICIEIMKELREYPGAYFFNNPVDLENIPGYLKKIKNPQDLGSILSKLENDGYTKINDWEKDINLVWTNAEIFNGKDSYVTTIAGHMAKHFLKLKKRVDVRRFSGWMKYIYSAREKIDRLLLSPPPNYDPIFPITYASNIQYPPFSNRELDSFVQASNYFFKNEDKVQIVKLLHLDPSYESFVDPNTDEIRVNADKLSPKCLNLIRDYFKKQLTKMGQEYPV